MMKKAFGDYRRLMLQLGAPKHPQGMYDPCREPKASLYSPRVQPEQSKSQKQPARQRPRMASSSGERTCVYCLPAAIDRVLPGYRPRRFARRALATLSDVKNGDGCSMDVVALWKNSARNQPSRQARLSHLSHLGACRHLLKPQALFDLASRYLQHQSALNSRLLLLSCAAAAHKPSQVAVLFASTLKMTTRMRKPWQASWKTK